MNLHHAGQNENTVSFSNIVRPMKGGIESDIENKSISKTKMTCEQQVISEVHSD